MRTCLCSGCHAVQHTPSIRRRRGAAIPGPAADDRHPQRANSSPGLLSILMCCISTRPSNSAAGAVHRTVRKPIHIHTYGDDARVLSSACRSTTADLSTASSCRRMCPALLHCRREALMRRAAGSALPHPKTPRAPAAASCQPAYGPPKHFSRYRSVGPLVQVTSALEFRLWTCQWSAGQSMRTALQPPFCSLRNGVWPWSSLGVRVQQIQSRVLPCQSTGARSEADGNAAACEAGRTPMM